jgi:hypothetical protein
MAQPVDPAPAAAALPAPAPAGALPAELSAALDLISQGCALISQNSPGALSEDARQLRPAIVLLQHAAAIISGVPEAGQSATLRWRIYQLIQAQQSDDACFYKELRCAIHLGLCGEVGGDPVTLPGCGHTYCRECIAPVMAAGGAQRKCPQCRVPIAVAVDALRTNVAIKGVVDRLLPRQPQAQQPLPAASGGGGVGP